MAQLNVKTGDKVVVITGKDAGKQGKVLATNPSKNRIVVEGVNIISHHTKPRTAQENGGIIKKEGTIDVSNVMIICPTCGKPTRVKHSAADGKSVRVCKCGAVLDTKYEKKTAKKATSKKEAKKPTTEEKETKKSTKLDKKDAPATKASTKNKAESVRTRRKQEM